MPSSISKRPAARRCGARRHHHTLAQKLLRQRLQSFRHLLALILEQRNNLRLRSWLIEFRPESTDELHKIKAFHSGTLLDKIHLLLESSSQRNVSQQLANALRPFSRAEPIFVFRYLFRDRDCILAHRPVRRCQFFCSVVVHSSVYRARQEGFKDDKVFNRDNLKR